MVCVNSRPLLLLLLLLICLVHVSVAFAPSLAFGTAAHHTRPSSFSITALRSSTDEAAAAAAAAVPAPTAAQDDEKVANIDEPPMDADTHEELMYALGVNLARQLGDVRPFVENGEELASVAKGLLDTIVGRLSEDGQRNLLARRGSELNTLITNRATAIKDGLAKEGREMLQQMKETEGGDIQELPSGVVLHVLEYGPEGKGQGVRPTKASTVKIHYHGTLANGEIFDSTLANPDAEPVKLPLAGVIPGWRDGVLKMHEGETAMLGIPPDQAYGEAGTPDGRIPGDSTLFFKIQLLEVMSAGIGGGATLLGADGNKLDKNAPSGGLLGVDGKPL